MIRILTLIVCVAMGTIQVSAAQAPQAPTSTTRLVRFAGVLTDAAGGPLTGPQTVTFTLFEQADGGTPLWTETLPVTADDRGRYAVALGASTPLPQELFTSEQARWIGTAIGGRDLGRTALVAVPYALKAADADTLGGQPAATYVRTREDGRLETSAGLLSGPAVDGTGVAGQIAKWTGSTTLSSSVISETVSNRIGFGLTDPTGGGVVDSVFTIRNFDNNTGFGILNETQQRRFAINTLFSGGWLLYDGGSGTWNAGLGQLSGRVGIQNPAPEETLHVGAASSLGTVRIDSPFNAAPGPILRWTENGGPGSFNGFEAEYRADVNDRLIFRSLISSAVAQDNILVLGRGTGFVGMGITGLPLDRLHVEGDIRVGTGITGCVKDADGTVIAGVCSSDLRLKKNITPFSSALSKVSQLRPVSFDWRSDEFPDRHFGAARSFGLIAQEVEAVLPELVVTDEKGYKAIKYNQLPFYVLQAVKELKVENDTLMREKENLQQQLQGLEERLRRLEALISK